MPVDVPGLVSATDLHATLDGIAEWQLPSGMIPWFPGGHADPWNHVECAMALYLGDLRSEAERAYQWLADIQRPDGAWHQYYLADRVEKEKLDANAEMWQERERAWGLEREKDFWGPTGVCVDDEGRIFVVESARNRLQVYHKLSPTFVGPRL